VRIGRRPRAPLAPNVRNELTNEEHEQLIDDTFHALDEFLASHDHVFAVTTPTDT
jgi:hypothetical protein